MKCYCCSGNEFSDCCDPILSGHRVARSAEALMRSRFTAYCLGDYTYVYNTYTKRARETLSVEALEQSAVNTLWFALNTRTPSDTGDQVEFSAFYFEGKKTGILHETSVFELENGEWRYKTGTLHSDTGQIKIRRNDICPCSSGKKFKQCCLRKIP